MRRLVILHFTPPSVVGGVEHIMRQHAHLLQARGWDICFVSGREGALEWETRVLPMIDPAGAEGGQIEAELAAGAVTPRFHAARRSILSVLAPLLAAADAVVVHNAFTLHFSLPLTAALWELAGRRASPNFIAWCHDLAWTNPLYIPSMHEGYPWDLLRLPAPNVQYVTVSEERKSELLDLWDFPGRDVTVVPNGIDVASALRLSPDTAQLAEKHRLFDRDAVLYLPVRITRRKNIEAAIRAVAALRGRGLDVCFLVSGPTAPHHPGLSMTYLEKLKMLCIDLDVRDAVIFLAEERGANLDYTTVSELYGIADVVLFPSAQEGFGLPILEAGLAHVPVVLSNIPIFQEVGGEDVWVFDLDAAAEDIASRIIEALQTRPARLFRRVLRQFRWEVVVEDKIVPILERPSVRGRQPGHV